MTEGRAGAEAAECGWFLQTDVKNDRGEVGKKTQLKTNQES